MEPTVLMLLSCDNHCCEQMVAGSSTTSATATTTTTTTKSCRQQNCSPTTSAELTRESETSSSCSYQPAPASGKINNAEQSCSDNDCKLLLAQANHQGKGLKRRQELADTLPGTVALDSGTVPTNMAGHQHHQPLAHLAAAAVVAYQTAEGDGATPHHRAIVLPRCTIEKCSAYSTPSPQDHQMQGANMDSGLMSGDSGQEGDNCETCCDGEDYDYETILTKILNEKKLALSRSPEVIEFFQQIQQPRSASDTNTEARLL